MNAPVSKFGKFHVMGNGNHGTVLLMGKILEGDVESAAAEHRHMLPIFKAIFWVTNPVPIKYAVNRSGMDIGGTRLPLWGPDEAFKAKFDPVMDNYDIDLPVDSPSPNPI